MKHYAIHYKVRGIAKITCAKGHSSTEALKSIISKLDLRSRRFFKLEKIDTIPLFA